MKKQISIFLIASLLFPLAAVDETSQPASGQKPKASQNAEEKKPEEKSTEPEKKGPILRNYEMIAPYEEITHDKSIMEHYTINIAYGILSGALIGMGAGLYSYETDLTTGQMSSTSLNNMFLFGGIGGGVGLLSGIGLSIVENSLNQPLVLGLPIFEKIWYGTMIGGVIGAVAGLIPYGLNGSTGLTGESDVILQYTGYGFMGGFALGVLLNFIIPQDVHFSYQFVATPELTQASITIPF